MEEKQLTPTYLSIPKLAKVVDILKSRNLTQVDADYFVSKDFSKADAYLAISTLRFLGVVNEDGSTDDSIKKFQLVGDAGQQAVAAILKNAYSHLFTTFVDTAPYDVDTKELQNEFLIQYGMSQRTAGPAVKAFVWLCEYAGLKEKTIKVQERTKRTTKKEITSKSTTNSTSAPQTQNPKNMDTSSEGVFLPLNGGIKLWVPIKNSSVSQAIAVGELKSSVESLNEFASKFLVEETSVGTDEQENDDL